MPDEHAPRLEALEKDLYRLIQLAATVLPGLLDHTPEWAAEFARVEAAESLALELAERYGVAA
jgi:hypothetical protein